MVINSIRRLPKREKLVCLEMLMDGINASTIHFFADNVEALRKGSACAAMARNSQMAPPAASRHLHTLEKNGYVVRKSHRVWELRSRTNDKNRDPDILNLDRRIQYAS